MADNLPIIAERSSVKVALEAGRSYRWCSCGRSATQPWCDDACDRPPVSRLRPLEFVADKSETRGICRCKHTKNAPFCDGSHRSLPDIEDLRQAPSKL